MRDSTPFSVRESLSVIPRANRFQHSPSLLERGLGGEVLCFWGELLPPLPCHLPKHLAVEAAFSL